jgi:predicted kinase
MVRVKVAAIRLGQQAEGSAGHEETRNELLTYLRLAESYTEPPRPALLITHGLSGSGKSTACARIPEWLPALRIRSDVERKRLAGLESGARSGSGLQSGIYDPERTMRTYDRLRDLARTLVAGGHTAVVDATFLKGAQRAPFKALAAELGVPFLILDFDTPLPVLRERVEQRERAGGDPSEAGLEVLELQVAAAEPFTADERPHVLTLTPAAPLTAEELLQRLAA